MSTLKKELPYKGLSGKLPFLSPPPPGRHQTNTLAPRNNPASTAQLCLPPLCARYTQARARQTHTCTGAHTPTHIPHYTHSRTESGEIEESEPERCFGVMGGNVGVSSGIDEVLFQRLSLEQGRGAGCVNERSGGGRAGAERQSIELLESPAEPKVKN